MPDLPEVISTLTENQLAFVQARRFTSTDAEAAEAVGLAPQTVYNWPNKEELREAVVLLREQDLEEAKGRLMSLSNKAIDVLDDEMNPGQRQRLDVAFEVLDRVGLTKVQDHSGQSNIPSGLLPPGHLARGVDALYEALRIRVIATDDGGQGVMDSPELATVDGVYKPSG